MSGDNGDNGDNVWILGTYMTKFGRHTDKDLIDLASEAALGAMKDGAVTIHDMEVLGCGSLFNADAGVGQQLQKQIGQTGIPVYNVAKRVRDGRHRTAHRAADHQGGGGRHGSRRWGGADGQGWAARHGRQGRAGQEGLRAERPLRLGDVGRRVARHRADAGRVRGRRAWSTRTSTAASTSSSSPRSRRRTTRTRHSTRSRTTRSSSRSTRCMAAEMMSYPNTLLMCCPNTDGAAASVIVSEEKLRTLSKEQQARAVKISASVLTTDPWTEHAEVQPDVNTLTRQRGEEGVRASRGRSAGPRLGGAARLFRDRPSSSTTTT